jgi:hypothetical protein
MSTGKATVSGEGRAAVVAVVALAVFGAVAALGAAVLDGAAAIAFGAACTACAGVAGLRLGRDAAMAATRMRLYRVADELAQYRAFTHLMRAQHDRIVELSGDAALSIASGLRDIDGRAVQLAARLEDAGGLRAEAEAVAAPVMDMVGKLQFQDVTRQQLGFLSRLSLILDGHMADLALLLGERRSLDRTTRFKELFEQALDDTVMASQRNDHHHAGGDALFEQAGPAVELFSDESEAR